MAAPNMVDVDPAAVAGPGPGAAPPPVAPVSAGGPGMPAMPGVTVNPGPKGPNFDPTGTVPVAGSPADPNHPAQQAPPVAVAPKTAEEAADREFKAKSEVADVDQKIADNAVKSGEADETRQAKEAELRKAQVAEQEKEDARQAAGIAKATAERDRLQANVQDFKFHNFWDKTSTAQAILAGAGIILGSASYGQNHVNQAAASIDNAIANEWEQQKAELVKRRDDAQAAGADLTELQRQYKEDSGRLALRQEAQLKALADEMDALASHSKNQAGILAAQKIAAEARAAAEAQGAAGVKAIAAAHSEALKDEETKAQTAEALAKAGKLAHKGAGGGGGASPAFQTFVDAAGQLKPGDRIPGSVAVLAAKAGIKPKDIADQVNKYRNSGSLSEADANKAAGKGPGGKPLLVVRDVDGKPLGVAQNPRGIEKIKEDVRKFTRAIKVLKEEQGKAGFFQNKNNPAFHNAVLAVAAASNAGVSVESMHHEEGTLTNALGRPDKDAIQAKIEELTGNLNAITNQLDPLPEGYVDAKEDKSAGSDKLNDKQKANLPSGWSVAN